ncbi:hypothetical protein CPB83DRAFT_737052, partial [Crepidotus variabilis]
TVILGSNALLVFHPGTFAAGDLDIYAPYSSMAIVSRFLTKKRYQCTFGPHWYSTGNPSISTVAQYAFKNKSIDVVYSNTKSAIQVVAEFHSSLVMNYVAHFGAVCLYPGPTLSKVGIMNSNRPRAIKCREKYKERGFYF